jgi:hypothetical protein
LTCDDSPLKEHTPIPALIEDVAPYPKYRSSSSLPIDGDRLVEGFGTKNRPISSESDRSGTPNLSVPGRPSASDRVRLIAALTAKM